MSFELNPHHGDADLFISRDFRFPHKEIYSKKSQRTGSLVDFVTFTKDENATTSLAGVYYIGVYAYTYTTYSIAAYVHRSGDQSPEDLKKRATLLFQGVPVTKKFDSSDKKFLAYFDLDLEDDEDYSIYINLNNV